MLSTKSISLITLKANFQTKCVSDVHHHLLLCKFKWTFSFDVTTINQSFVVRSNAHQQLLLIPMER